MESTCCACNLHVISSSQPTDIMNKHLSLYMPCNKVGHIISDQSVFTIQSSIYKWILTRRYIPQKYFCCILNSHCKCIKRSKEVTSQFHVRNSPK